MIKGLYVAGTNMTTNIKRMDVISNNLANINTTGFKKDDLALETFNNRLFSRINGSNIPFEGGVVNVSQDTNRGATVLTTSTGYFRVQTDNGIHYDKAVQFFKDTDGYLRTVVRNIGGTIDPLKGNLVLGQNGPINIGDNDFTIDDKGGVNVNGTRVDALVVTGFPNVVGTMSAGIRGYDVLTNHEQGQLEMTNNGFDMALKGDGFFVIENDKGTFLTRNGSFTLNNQNILTTLDGDVVQGLNGPIFIDSPTFAVNSFGEIIQDGEITDKITIQAFSNIGDVYKVGGNYYKTRETMTGELIEFTGEVVQGFLEKSNAESITEMIHMIEMNRNYETSQKVISTIDEMIGKAVTELGRV